MHNCIFIIKDLCWCTFLTEATCHSNGWNLIAWRTNSMWFICLSWLTNRQQAILPSMIDKSSENTMTFPQHILVFLECLRDLKHSRPPLCRFTPAAIYKDRCWHEAAKTGSGDIPGKKWWIGGIFQASIKFNALFSDLYQI